MFTFLIVLSIFSALSILAAGSLSLLRNPSKKVHLWFFFFTLSLFFWIPINFYDSNVVNSFTVFFTKLDYSIALLVAWILLQFSSTFVQDITTGKTDNINKFVKSHSFRLLTTILNICLVLAITSNKLIDVSIDGGKLAIDSLPLSQVYNLVIIFYFGLALLILGRAYLKSEHGKHQGIDLIWIGLFVAVLANLCTNILFPELIDNRSLLEELNIIGYIGILAFIGCIYFAISVKKLFDIRLIVARSLAYVLLLSSLAAAYFALLLTLTIYFIPSDELFLQQITSLFVALLVASTAPFFRKNFDKLTNRIFYRDAYDPQLFLDTLNKALVGEIEIEKLLDGVSVIMENNLKSSYVAIGVKETDNRPLRILGANAPKYKPDDIMFVRSELVKMGQKTVLASNLSSDRRKLQEIFRQNDIEIIVRLLTGYDTEEEAIAYLILGPKKSGNIYNKQDLAILGIIADELVIAIQNTLRFEEIQAFAVTLQEKVDEATAKLRRTNLKLKEMDETKDEFISMASHQLRTPLTSVKGYLSMVLDGDAGALKPQQKELLEQSFLSSQRMVYIIADLLNVSRLKTGKFVLDINPTDLVNVVQGEIDQLHEAFRSKNLKIAFTKPKDFPTLLLDETKIRQVIMNFIDNAVYYTPAGGNIWVELKQDKKHVYFTVKDSGLGVPKSEQSHLFGKFYRATNARKARPDGTGLGLFMAKRVVLAQGGSILFESAEGKGSTFGFCFETEKLLPKTEK